MQKLQFSIPEPCHENWQQMTPTDQRRFCNACAKEVVDFSMMTDTEVLNYFTTLTHEKVCGRALPDQLNRTISRPKDPKKRLFWYWNYIVMFFMFFGKGSAAKAQGDVKATTELSPVKGNEINKTFAGKIGEIKSESQVISGKVTDSDNNPVSFASIKIKSRTTGVIADAKGVFSIRINPNDVLIISGFGNKTTEVPFVNQKELNVVMEVDKYVFLGEIVTTSCSSNTGIINAKNQIANIVVKDEETSKGLKDAKILINKNFTKKSDTAFSDGKGIYKLKGIKAGDTYNVKIQATSYEPAEFTISGVDFNDRKKEWEVLLRRQKIDIKVREVAATKPGNETTIRMGGVQAFSLNKGPIYVVDGVIMQDKVEVNPDDIEDYSVLQGAAGAALFGPEAANGAIVITTKKLNVKNLDTVLVTAYGKTTGKLVCTTTTTSVMGGMVKGYTMRSRIADSLRMVATKITGGIKIYPNPVQHGNTFNISLKLKQTGLYQILIADAAGRVVLQKQIHAVLKEFTEKIQADTRWSSGVYYISLVDNKNKLVNKSSFIFQ
jgi:TonB-dependent SusC/RagA subfamily outer membrane receptor